MVMEVQGEGVRDNVPPEWGEGFESWRGSDIETMTAKELGRLGETLAALYLQERGYAILEHGYRCREGEADLIAFDDVDDVVVLVEVKARRVRTLDEGVYPEEAVNRNKQRRYRRIAACYLMQHYPIPAIRFDVIAISICSDSTAGIEHIIGAFDWDAGQ